MRYRNPLMMCTSLDRAMSSSYANRRLWHNFQLNECIHIRHEHSINSKPITNRGQKFRQSPHCALDAKCACITQGTNFNICPSRSHVCHLPHHPFAIVCHLLRSTCMPPVNRKYVGSASAWRLGFPMLLSCLVDLRCPVCVWVLSL